MIDYFLITCRLLCRASEGVLRSGKTRALKSIVDEAQVTLPHRRIYVLGIGNIGRLFAHSIARLSNRPPVTLLFHRPSLVHDFKRTGEKIEIVTHGVSNKQSGFDYEVVGAEAPVQHPEEVIYNLIVTTKATQTLRALSAIKHRLTSQSTILFTQNGLGTTSHLSALFSTPACQPTYLTAVVFHGIYSTAPFTSIHAGAGFLHLAPTFISPTALEEEDEGSYQYLLSTTLQLPAVNALAATPQELLIIQLEKLVVNAIINPLTALFRIRNGELYGHDSLGPLIKAVIAETSAVILALPELKEEGSGVRERFGVGALGRLVKEKALLTRWNKSSMLQDVEDGKETEIRFINGWVVERGIKLGVQVGVSERVVKMMEEKRVIGLLDVAKVFSL